MTENLTPKTDHADYGKLLFESTAIGLALCEMNGDLVDVNHAYAQLIGRSIAETLTLSYWEITPEKYQADESEQLESLQSKGKFGPYEKEYIHSKGHLIPVRLWGQIVTLNNKQYIWSSVEDISDKKNAEQELKRLYKEVKRLSTIDDLTGLASRRLINQTLDKEWRRAVRDNTPLSAILIDIDYFKQFNDLYGHLEGDKCLKQVAKSLQQCLKRSSDFIGRYGGEEFIILLPNTSHEDSMDVAEHCLKNIKQLNILNEHSKISEYLTISAGIAILKPNQSAKSSSLIRYADKLLYNAKNSGRDCIKVKAY